MPGQAHSLYGPPAVISRRQGGHVSSPLPGIGVNFLPQRRHRRFRTRGSSVSKNRPRLVPAISPPHAPDCRARARSARAHRPPIGIAVRRHSWNTVTASRACCAPHLDCGTSRTSPRALPRQPRKRTHRSGAIVMAGAGHTPHAGTIANVDAEGIRHTRRRRPDCHHAETDRIPDHGATRLCYGTCGRSENCRGERERDTAKHGITMVPVVGSRKRWGGRPPTHGVTVRQGESARWVRSKVKGSVHGQR